MCALVNPASLGIGVIMMKQIMTVTMIVGVMSFWNISTFGKPGSTPRPTPPTKTYVLIIGGINKDVEERQSKDRSVMKLRKNAPVVFDAKPEDVFALVDGTSLVTRPTGICTAQAVEKTVKNIADRVRPTDRFILFYIGQANVVNGHLRLNLSGPDITPDDLVKWIANIKTSTMVLVLDCPGAGLAIKPLTGKGRILIAGARGDQLYSTMFSEFFIPALSNPESDLNHDSRISLLEAFQRAGIEMDEFYRQRNFMKTENPLLEDDGDGIPSQQPWLYKKTKKDGLRAANFFLNGTLAGNKKP
jgi:hypothetical protein